MVQTFADKINPAQPNLLGSFMAGRQFRQSQDDRALKQQQQATQAQREQTLAQLGQQFVSAPAGERGAIGAQLAGLDPDTANKLQSFVSQADEQKLEAAARNNGEVFRSLQTIRAAGQQGPEAMAATLRQEGNRLIEMGIDPSSFTQGLTMENLPQRIEAAFAQAQSVDQLVKGEIDRRKPAKPLVSITNTDQTAEAKELGKLRAQRFDKTLEGATSAANTLERVNTARLIAGRSELPSDLQSVGGEVATFLGLDPDRLPGLGNITGGQEFNAVIGDLVLEKMASQKGPQTDRDADRIRNTLARLGNTPEARDFLLRSSAMFAGADLLKADFVQEFQDSNNTLRGAEKAWRKVSRNMPLLKENARKADAQGQPQIVFLHEFLEQAQQANPDATIAEIIELWKR